MLNRFSKVVSHNNQPHCWTPFPIGREQTNRSLFDHPHFGFWVKMQNGEKFYPKNLNCEAFCLHGRRLFLVLPFGGCVYMHHMVASSRRGFVCGGVVAKFAFWAQMEQLHGHIWRTGGHPNLPWLLVICSTDLGALACRFLWCGDHFCVRYLWERHFEGFGLWSPTGSEAPEGFKVFCAHLQHATRWVKRLVNFSESFIDP